MLSGLEMFEWGMLADWREGMQNKGALEEGNAG